MADEAELAADQHVRYIVTVEKKKDSFESLVMEHIRLNGAYWGLTTLDLLHKLHAVDAAEVVDWIMSCYHPESGGFGGNVGHDPHVLYTLSAVQVLCLFDRLDVLDVDKMSPDCKTRMDHFLAIFGVKLTLGSRILPYAPYHYCTVCIKSMCKKLSISLLAVRTWMVDLVLCQEGNLMLDKYFVVSVHLQSPVLSNTLIEISSDGGSVSASVKMEDLMGGLRN